MTPLYFPTPAEWNAWLAENPQATEAWLLFHRKSTGVPSLTWEQSVIEALAHGWIDGIKKTASPTTWIQRFTPRKKTSVWSQKNVAHIENLIAAGRMQPAGMAAVEIARQNGRWDAAYAVNKNAELPQEFLDALAQNPAAQAGLDRLNGANRAAIHYRLTTAKLPATRVKRIADFITKLTLGQNIL